MSPASLSDMPVEILDIILRSIMDDSPTSLFPFLHSNKELFSRAVKFLYQNARPFPGDQARSRKLLETLVSSVKGSSYSSYHEHIHWLSIRASCNSMHDSFHELFAKVLQFVKIQHLELCIGERHFPSAGENVPMLTKLEVSVGEQFSSEEDSRTWMQIMIPPTPLHTLDAILEKWRDSRVRHTNSIKTLLVGGTLTWDTGDIKDRTSVSQTFISPHCNTLTFIKLTFVNVAVATHINLPSLQTLSLTCCRLEGWENLCTSLTSLKHLEFGSVEFLGLEVKDALRGIPARTLQSLETLELTPVISLEEAHLPWLGTYASALPSLRRLSADVISVDELATILTHCSSLRTLQFYKNYGDDHPAPNDELLGVISRLATSSLRSLSLWEGEFSSAGLDAFASFFPATVTSLNLSCSYGLTPSVLRKLIQLPLQYLKLCGMLVMSEHKIELETISILERPLALEHFLWSYDRLMDVNE